MTTMQFIGVMILLMLVWLGFQIALEVFRSKILIKRQEEIVDKTVSRIYDQVCRHGVKLYRDLKEVREVMK